VLVAEVVLLQDPQLHPLGHGDGALGGLVLAGEDAQEGRLAGAVGAHQAVTVAGNELDRDPLEEGLGSKRFAKVGDGDHRAEDSTIRKKGVRMRRQGARGTPPWRTAGEEVLFRSPEAPFRRSSRQEGRPPRGTGRSRSPRR